MNTADFFVRQLAEKELRTRVAPWFDYAHHERKTVPLILLPSLGYEAQGDFFMQKLWQKDWQLNDFIEAFETKGDLVLDQKIIKADVLGTLAHAQMLMTIGILSNEELKKAKQGLLKILKLSEKGKFILVLGDEDIHTKIENTLTAWYGDVGKKIHTGRSRNDQVLAAIRLCTKEQMLAIWSETLFLIEGFLSFAKKYEMVAMPGYTHMQKAMPSSVGMWASSFAAGLLDCLVTLKASYSLNNQSPLGSAAAYGVPLAIDREYCAQLLGFAKVQANSLYCQNSRGIIEAVVVASLVSVLQTISKFASDVLLFTTSEFHLFDVHATMCSGSSIMPQKKNVDVAELLRAKVYGVLAHYTQLVSLSSGLPSGYNRDVQETKKPLFESLETTVDSLGATTLLLARLTPNAEALEKSMTPELFATHEVLTLVVQGVPFREAYERVVKHFKMPQPTSVEVQAMLSASKHTGSTGNLGLAHLYTQLSTEKQVWEKEWEFHVSSINYLVSGMMDPKI